MVGQYTFDPRVGDKYVNYLTGLLHTKVGIRCSLGWGGGARVT